MTDTFINPNGKAFTPADVEIDDPEDEDQQDEDQHYTTIAFDPGGTTGWSVTAVHPDAIEDEDYRIQDNIVFWSAGEFTGEEDVMASQMLDLARAWPKAKIVIEDFVLRKFSSGRELLSPVRVTAKFEFGLKLYFTPHRPIIKQPPSLAMSTITDLRLQKMGMYNPLQGKEHGRDALRHNLTWLRRAKQMASQKKIASAFMGPNHDGADAGAGAV